MNRVVCPVCKAGFEARFTRENCAINCLTCGVAFNASSFLPKADAPRKAAEKVEPRERYTGPVLIDSPKKNDSTHTAALPFPSLEFGEDDVSAPSIDAPKTRKSPSEPTPLPVIPKAPPSVKPAASNGTYGSGFLPTPPENRAPENRMSAFKPDSLPKEKMGKSPSERMQEIVSVPTPMPMPAPLPGSNAKAAAVTPLVPPKASAPAPAAAPAVANAAASSGKIAAPVPAVTVGKAAPVGKGEPTPMNAPAKAVPAKNAEFSAEPLVRPVVSEPLRSKKSGRRPLLEGSFGKYDIEGEIARGGVGAVFRARERETGNPFALKVMIEGDDIGETERERFRRECETAKSISLPGMVHIHEVGEHEGRPYMAMELVEGKSLDKVISERALTVNACLVLMKTVAATVGGLHENGYVHRDLKPGNILLDAFDSPKVTDYGLVKSLDEVTRMTASGLVCGTPAYMSPEQARGDGKSVDPRSDVWALGAVLYEMLAGEPPFKADNALKLMLRITKEQPKRLTIANRKVPIDVEAIVMKCLDKNPARRYANGKALAADITMFLEGGKPQVTTQSKVHQLFSVASKNRATIIPAAAAIVAVAIIGIVAHAIFSKHDPAPLVEQGIKVLKDNPQGDEAQLRVAQRYFQDAIVLDPSYARAYWGLGASYARRGIDRKTHKIVNQELVDKAFRANDLAAKKDPKLRTEVAASSATYNMWLGQHAKEAADWERVVQMEPANLEFRKSLAMAYWNAGVEKRNAKYFQLALVEFKSILSARPDYPGVQDHIRNIERNFLVSNGAAVGMAARN